MLDYYKSSVPIVKRYYDYHAEYEAMRLFQDPYHMLEFIVTFHYLKKYLRGSGDILDCGCGSGNYAIVLAGMGYRIALVDISQKLLDIAVEKFRRANRTNRLISVVRTSATDLSMFRDDSFDAVLCFGPLYHLPRRKDQVRAVMELRRVLKSGGILFVSAISYFGVLGVIAKYYPDELLLESHKLLFEEGIHLSEWHNYDIHGFPDAKFWRPLELKNFLERQGFITLEMAACEGVFTHLKEYINNIAKDKKKWRKIIEIAIETSNEPTIIGNTEHFLWIGRKP